MPRRGCWPDDPGGGRCRREKEGIGGGLLSGIALLIGLSQAAVIGGAAKAISDAAKQQQTTNQQVVTPSAAPTGAPQPQPTVNALPAPEAEQWAPATSPIRQGETEIRITSVSVAPVKLKERVGDGEGRSKEPQLIVGVELHNVSATKKLNYRSWAGRDLAIGRDFGTLEDNFGNGYKRVTFGMMSQPVGHVEMDSIYPGRTLSDVLVFEPPLSNAEYLNLELPAENIGGKGMLRIRIPAAMIKR